MNIYFVASLDRFIKPIINELTNRGYNCSLSNQFDRNMAAQADVIWCEWADENAVAVMEYNTPAKKILRIHRYEVYTDIWQRLHTDAFDIVVFVSDVMRRELEQRLGKTIANSVTISNYVNPANYTGRDMASAEAKNIGYAGYFCRKKGFGELVMLAHSFPDYNFHAIGDPQELDIISYMEDANKPANLTFLHWDEDLNNFFQNMDYVINTSLSESFSIATIEGMLCGCKPIVRNWLGAKELYPAECIYDGIQDIYRILEAPIMPEYYRQYAIDNLKLDTVIDDIVGVIEADLPDDEYMPTITVGIVQTRQKYLPELLNSLRMQDYPIDVRILQNFDKDKSIGKCFNELADNCSSEFILYVGDDDWLAEGYVADIMKSYCKRRKAYPNTAAIFTSTTAFDDNGSYQLIPHHSTGVWRTSFVRQHRFNEELVRQVDTEFHSRAYNMKTGSYTILELTWLAGYMYRQHSSNISGNKFTEGANLSQEQPK